jgi:hypothetical protein
MRPVLLLEINEVPLKMYRKYAADPRFPHVRELFESFDLVETLNTDPGELSPWCTWPTLHRGLPKEKHGVHYLGQDPATYKGTAIWDEILQRGHSVGIFGSLQSWPPREPGPGGFYVPDTFAPTAECRPAWLEPVQALNLGLVRENGRVMSEGLGARVLNPRLVLAFLRAGVRFRTLASAALQLVMERIRPSYRQRRVTFQARLFWDIFRKLYSAEHPPEFSTFFTNHVASVEHRYWNHVFPEQFERERRPAAREHLATMDFAMRTVDDILAEAISWQKRNPGLVLVVANSMGQDARVSRKHNGYELMFDDVTKLFAVLGIPAGVKQNLAMAPQLCFDLAGLIEPEKFMALLGTFKCATGRPVLLCDNRNQTVTVTVDTPPVKDLDAGALSANGRSITLEEAGMRRITIEAGTAYHVPEGELFVRGIPKARLPGKRPLPAHEVKAVLMDWAELGEFSPAGTAGERIQAARV